jgi:hypothetical protein
MSTHSARPWIVWVAVTGLLLAFGIWIANNTHWEEITIPMPLKGEAVTNPQYAQRVFLEALGVKVESRQSFTTPPPQHAVVIVSSWHWDLIEVRRKKMEEWIRAGGRLVVDTTLLDSLEGFERFSGIKSDFPKPDEDEDEEEDEESADEETEEVESESALDVFGKEKVCVDWKISIDTQGVSGGRDQYAFCGSIIYGWLVSDEKPIWALSDERGYQAVRVSIGKGSVTVLNGTLFDNAEFRDAERGALFVAAAQLRKDDPVWLLTESEHPSVLQLVWRYGAPAVVLFAFFVAVVLWRNATRFGSLRAPPDPARRSLAEQIRGTGWFILRLGGSHTLYKAMLRAVKEAAARRIPRFHSLTPQQQLEALVASTGVDRDELQQAFILIAPNALGPMRSQPRHHLYKAIALLETVRRILQSQKASSTSHTESTSKQQEAPHAN